jgi:hypothetical protein
MNLSELAQYISDEEKAEQILHELGFLNDISLARSAGRITSGESGDSSLCAIVVTKSGASAGAVFWKS